MKDTKAILERQKPFLDSDIERGYQKCIESAGGTTEILLSLELKGMARQLPGKMFVRL